MDTHYNTTNPRIQWCVYDANGTRVYFGAVEVATTHGPATSANALFFSGGPMTGGSMINLGIFSASRWARRAPG
jgi:hypothetical protein